MFRNSYAVTTNRKRVDGFFVVEVDMVDGDTLQYYVNEVMSGHGSVIADFQRDVLPGLPILTAFITVTNSYLSALLYRHGTWLSINNVTYGEGNSDEDERYTYEITTRSEEQSMFAHTFDSVDPPLYRYRGEILQTTSPVQAALEKLFDLNYDRETDNTGECASITPTTVFGSVEILYVGAALCCVVREPKVASAAKGNIVAIFDAGAGSGKALQATAEDNADIIEGLLNSDRAIDVILSHFHKDHISILSYVAQNRAANFNNMHLHYPKFMSNTPNAAKIINKFTRKTIYPDATVNLPFYAQYPLGANPNFTLEKIDYDAAKHPHHHGIEAKVTILNSRTEVLLSGDCTYAGTSDKFRNVNKLAPRVVLQASHHGGNYAVSPPKQTNPSDSIPKQTGAYVPRINDMDVIYSANGITYGHPKQSYVDEYEADHWESTKMHEYCAPVPPLPVPPPSSYDIY